MSSEMSEKQIYKDFIPEFLDQIQRITDDFLDSENIHTAFTYLIADMFETTHEDNFEYTDGPKDGGIDFFIQDTRTYSIYQCKCPDYETLDDSQEPVSFGKEPIQELLTGLQMLRNEENIYDVKLSISRLRSNYQRDLRTKDEPVLTINVAVMGELSPAGKNLYKAERSRLREEGIDFNLITWQDIYNALHVLDAPEQKDMQIELGFGDIQKEVLRHNDYCYLLAYAKDFYDAWSLYEWNLFDWNVRLQLYKSQINKRIIASLKSLKSQKIFHHLNNGITITCKSYSIDKSNKQIKLNNPQIINGCQTVCAIRDAYDSMTPYDQEEFEKRTRVQVKIIKTTDINFIGQMVITTNDQNPMSSRNLKSNSGEQKTLQKNFRSMNEKWFYERKDGEWKSLLTSSRKIQWFHLNDFCYPPKRYRIIDNKTLAKIWYSWLGHSDKALKGGIDYFENDDIYDIVFRSVPKSDFWDDFSSDIYFSSEDRYFDPGIPSVFQYLLVLTVYKFITSKRLSWKTNKDEAINRGISQGILKKEGSTNRITSTKVQIDEFLSQDPEYRINIMLNNMNEILLELFSFILSKKYGELSPNTSKKILENAEISKYKESNFLVDFLPNEEQAGNQILGPIYAFIKYSLKQFYFENHAEIMATPRIKSYLFNRKIIQRLKGKVIQTNSQIQEFIQPWKQEESPFFNTLPDL